MMSSSPFDDVEREWYAPKLPARVMLIGDASPVLYFGKFVVPVLPTKLFQFVAGATTPADEEAAMSWVPPSWVVKFTLMMGVVGGGATVVKVMGEPQLSPRALVA